jgi:hypothetical protein
VSGYNLYRSITSGENYSKVNTTLITETAYEDTSVSGGTTYYYVLTSADTDGDESVRSRELLTTVYEALDDPPEDPEPEDPPEDPEPEDPPEEPEPEDPPEEPEPEDPPEDPESEDPPEDPSPKDLMEDPSPEKTPDISSFKLKGNECFIDSIEDIFTKGF